MLFIIFPLILKHIFCIIFFSSPFLTLLSPEYHQCHGPVSGAQQMYILNFFCDHKAHNPVIQFDSSGIMSTTFRINTALACAPKPVSCVVQDSKGQQFDLSSLARKDDNWIVIDTRETHSDLRYHINVCRPVNPTKSMTCPG